MACMRLRASGVQVIYTQGAHQSARLPWHCPRLGSVLYMELQTLLLDHRLEMAFGLKWKSALMCSSVFTGWLQGFQSGQFPHVLPTSVEVDGHRNAGGFGKRQQALQRRGGEVLVKPRTFIFECKFIPAAAYWQKEGESLLLLRIISVLPCQSFARGGSAWRASLVTMLSLGQLCCVCPAQKPHFCFRNVLFAFQRLLWGALQCFGDPGV